MAAYLQVVLRETTKHRGKSGELVRVRPGYARNFLVPRGVAVYATEKNVARIEHEKREALARAAKLHAEHEAAAKKLASIKLTLKVKVGEGDRLYGSITSKDVAAELAKAGVEVDRRKLELGDIKAVGTYEVKARLSPDVTATLKLEVVKALRLTRSRRARAPAGSPAGARRICGPGDNLGTTCETPGDGRYSSFRPARTASPSTR